MAGFNEPLQIIHRTAKAAVEYEDLADLSGTEREERLAVWIEKEKRNDFELDKLPLIRFFIHRLTDETYRLIISFHDAILDGWSGASMLTELLQRYWHKIKRREYVAEPLPDLSFRDFIALEQATLKSEECRQFWAHQLQDAVITKLPRVLRKQPASEPEMGILDVPIPFHISDRLKELARNLGVPLKHVLLAAHIKVLSVLGAETDVLAGLESNGRLEVNGGEKILGLHLNTVPFRVKLKGGSWTDLIRQVFETEREILPYRRFPYAELQRLNGGQPLFESVFNYTNFHVFKSVEGLDGLEILDSVGYEHTHLTLKTEFNRDAFTDHVHLDLECDLRELDLTQLRFIGSYYASVLERIGDDPGGRYELFSPLTHEEKRQLLVEWNGSDSDYPAERTIHQLFEEQADRTPDGVAIFFEDRQITFGELNVRANQLSHYLRSLAVIEGEPIGLYVERSLEAVICILAILKTGAAYLPLDPTYPTDRIALMVGNSQLTVLLTQRRLLEKLPDNNAFVICIEDISAAASTELTPNPDCAGAPDSPAYIIYTSGSTGAPKGVVGLHKGMANRCQWMWNQYPFEAGEICCQKTALSFIDSLWEIFGPMLKGIPAVIIPDDMVKDPYRLVESLNLNRITRIVLVPSLLQALLSVFDDLQERLPELKFWVTSGEALPNDLASRFKLKMRHSVLINLYGMSEVSADVSCFDTSDGWTDSSVPIGKAIANTRIYVLDKHLLPVPVAVSGEIYIGGEGVGRGYFRRPDMTAEKFVPDPFNPATGSRLYRSGDVGRRLPDGNIEYIGRTDAQVKVRGFRVELGEIESVLLQQDGIKEAAASARKGDGNNKDVIAYVVMDEGAQITTRELRERILGKLPEYMVPRKIVRVEQMPLTPGGKLDRKALEKQEAREEEAGREYKGPSNEQEQVMSGIWRDVLGIERIGIDEKFGELGGHSILAVQLISRVREAFKVELALRKLYEHPSIAELVEEVEKQKGKGWKYEELPKVEKREGDRNEPFEMTEVQQAYWIGRKEAFELGNVGSHLYTEIEVEGLEVERMNRALERLIERHEMLRAVATSDGRQEILGEVPRYEIEVMDLRGKQEEELERELLRIRELLSHEIGDIERWPLFQIRASLLPQNRARLHIGLDLFIADALSIQILLSDLLKLYNFPEVILNPLNLSFRDYILAEKKLRETGLYEKSRQYWLERLKTLPPAPELPLAKNPESLTKPRFKRWEKRFAPDIWNRVKRRGAQAGLTPSGVLLAAFAEILGYWSKSDRFTLNLTLYNRIPLHEEVNQIVGDFTSLTMLEINNVAAYSFQERARQVQGQLLDDLDNRYFNGIEVIREMNKTARGTSAPVFPIVFTSALFPQGREMGAFSLRDFGTLVYTVSQTPQVWLDQQVMEEGGTLWCSWDAVEELFPKDMLDDMFSAYCALVEGLAGEEKAWQRKRCDYLPEYQRETRAAVNATHGPMSDELLHTLFEEQAAAHPERIAVITQTKTLSYGELNARTAKLGRKLRQMGAKPNKLIAVVMRKGWEQVVGVLGILKSGAAYLPIDAELPEQRINYLLEDGEVEIVVTQSWVKQNVRFKQGLEVIEVQAHLSAEPDYSQLQILDTLQKPEDLAYVIYTSGSTGLPKGVMIEHRAAVNTILDVNARYNIGPQDRVLALSSLSFDLSVYDIFGLLAAGGALVIPEADTQKDPGKWAQLITQHKVSVWNSVPALMDLMKEKEEQRGRGLSESLRVVMLSGDWIPVRLAKEISQHRQDIKLVSMGGATECAIWSVLEEIKQVDEASVSIPYGLPMQNQRMRISSLTGEEKPDWVIGEIRIAGEGLARGYWRDEQKSRERFVQQAGEREYRTGDLGRRMPDGRIEIIGREDNQVKVQGYRIELGEIEAALKQEAGVKAAVVTAIGEREGSKRLIGYVVMDGEEGAEREIKEKVRKKVPEYMVPSVIVRMERMPLTANGKIDRNALPDPSKRVTPETQNQTQPENDIVRQISSRVASVLKTDKIEPDANLIEFGASSVDAIRIANLLEVELGFRPKIEEFYREPTILGLVQSFERHLLANEMRIEVANTGGRAGAGASTLNYKPLFDLTERDEFKKRQPGLRSTDAGKSEISLAAPALAEKVEIKINERRSRRRYSLRPVPLASFSNLLSTFRQYAGSDEKPKYFYPSAGGIYCVQTYVYVKPGLVEGISAGIHYYNPKEHKLVTLAPNVALDRSIHEPFVNQPAFDESAFSIFLIGQLSAIVPLYGELARDFCLLEAGYMSQLMMMMAPSYQLGLCPIGYLNFDKIRELFELDANHVLLHSLLGGCVEDDEEDSIANNFAARGEMSQAARLLERVKQLSKEEIEAMLEAGKNADSNGDQGEESSGRN